MVCDKKFIGFKKVGDREKRRTLGSTHEYQARSKDNNHHMCSHCTAHHISHHEEHVSRAVDVSDHLPHISSSGVSLCEDKIKTSESEQTFGGYDTDWIGFSGRGGFVCVLYRVRGLM